MNSEIKEEQILNKSLVYKNNNNYYLITTFISNDYSKENNGYGELINNKTLLNKDLYLLIIYKKGNEVLHEEIKVNKNEIFNNNKLLIFKKKRISISTAEKTINLSQFDNSYDYKSFLLMEGFVDVDSRINDKKERRTMCTKNCLEKEIEKNEFIAFNYLGNEVSYYYEDNICMVKIHSTYDENKMIPVMYTDKKTGNRINIIYYIEKDYYEKEEGIIDYSKIDDFIKLFKKYRKEGR